jgi:hypothetical protein
MKVYNCSACKQNHDLTEDDIIIDEENLNYFICENTNIKVNIIVKKEWS